MEERLLFQEMFLKQLDILMQKKKNAYSLGEKLWLT